MMNAKVEDKQQIEGRSQKEKAKEGNERNQKANENKDNVTWNTMQMNPK